MGLFSRAQKPDPQIIVEGIAIVFRSAHGYWEFTYKCTTFCGYQTPFNLPSRTDLDSILGVVESLKTEMKSRLANGLNQCGNMDVNDGETYTLEVSDFTVQKTFQISWSGGASWGDVGVDFSVKEGRIIDEAWGD